MPRAVTRTLRASRRTGSTAPASTAWSNASRALCWAPASMPQHRARERMLRTLAQHQLASKQALSPLHSTPRAPAAALLNAEAQEPPLVVAALCSAACEQRSARQTRGTPGRLWDGGPPSECEPHRRPCLPQPRASGAKRQRRACFSVTVFRRGFLLFSRTSECRSPSPGSRQARSAHIVTPCAQPSLESLAAR